MNYSDWPLHISVFRILRRANLLLEISRPPLLKYGATYWNEYQVKMMILVFECCGCYYWKCKVMQTKLRRSLLIFSARPWQALSIYWIDKEVKRPKSQLLFVTFAQNIPDSRFLWWSNVSAATITLCAVSEGLFFPNALLPVKAGQIQCFAYRCIQLFTPAEYTRLCNLVQARQNSF